MTDRITIIPEDTMLKKLRERHAKQIKNSTKATNFSKIANKVLEKGLK